MAGLRAANGHNLFVPDGVERLPRSLRVAPPDVKELPSRLFHARKYHHGSAAIYSAGPRRVFSAALL